MVFIYLKNSKLIEISEHGLKGTEEFEHAFRAQFILKIQMILIELLTHLPK